MESLRPDRVVMALAAVGCGVYLAQNLYTTWCIESEKEWIRRNGYVRHPAYDSYPNLSVHNNLMACHLTPDVYEALKNKKTSGGYTLEKAIQVGVDCPGMPWERSSGVIAGDEHSYKVFALLFNKIIEDIHQYGPRDIHRKDMDSAISGENLNGKYAKSVRITALRSLKGYRLPAACCRQERRQIEHGIRIALCRLHNEFKGQYISIADISENYKKKLAARMLLPDPTAPAIMCSGRARDWPDARGIYVSDDKSFIVIVNEADHLKVVCLSKESNIPAAFEKFCRGLKALEEELKRNGEEFAWNDHLGYIVSDPVNLGTGLDVSIRVRLRRLSVDNRLHHILKALNLKRCRKGISSVDILKGEFYVRCYKCLGVSEVDTVKNLIHGVQKLIYLETQLDKGVL